MQEPTNTNHEALTAALDGLDVEKELEREEQEKIDLLSEINIDLEAYFAAQEREAGKK